MESSKFPLFFLLIVSSTLIPPSFCRSTTYKPKNSIDFANALKAAKAGDKILLQSRQSYAGSYTFPDKKSETPITVDGKIDSKTSANIAGVHTVLNVEGGKWIIQNLKISGGDTGISVKGNKNTFKYIGIGGVKDGVILHGDGNVLQDIRVVGHGNTGIGVTGKGNTGGNFIISGTQIGLRITNGESNNFNRVTTKGGKTMVEVAPPNNNVVARITDSTPRAKPAVGSGNRRMGSRDSRHI